MFFTKHTQRNNSIVSIHSRDLQDFSTSNDILQQTRLHDFMFFTTHTQRNNSIVPIDSRGLQDFSISNDVLQETRLHYFLLFTKHTRGHNLIVSIHSRDLQDFSTSNDILGTGYNFLETALTTSYTSSLFHLHRDPLFLFRLLWRLPWWRLHFLYTAMETTLHCHRYQDTAAIILPFYPTARKEQHHVLLLQVSFLHSPWFTYLLQYYHYYYYYYYY